MSRDRFVGIDVGAETVKVVELACGDAPRIVRKAVLDHHKDPRRALLELLSGWDWDGVASAAVTGRLGRLLALPRVPGKAALAAGVRLFRGDEPVTIVSIGAHGFSVLELRSGGVEVLRENNRCSQGTGNFLRQLVERFGLSVEEASALCAPVTDPAPLSGRCPVILKTDMTHLANKGEDRARILAGLFDAVCENVLVLVKPGVCPPRVLLAGGVARSARVREKVRRFLTPHAMELLDVDPEEALFLDAAGAATAAAAQRAPVPPIEALFAPKEEARIETIPSLAASLPGVARMTRDEAASDPASPLVLGFDIGSTGSKLVALEARTKSVAWEGYLRTNGDPVGAAQALAREFLRGPAGARPVVSLAATGSGREIVGSLLSVCFGAEAVYVLNEIAAHAAGALHYDPRVDTIFEIGGQDAKYIRLSAGRVVDSAMNEACSAGTGSFIEEQGRRFEGITHVSQMGEEALSASCGVSLGQHCSVFMAEIIDGAVAAGVDRKSILAGIHDSIVQNYLNRVKGARSVGQVIFCQGMPFASDALAAAVARQTGASVIVPPNPGTVGALGIALLALQEVATEGRSPIDVSRFLEARVDRRDTFVCLSTKGCGGAGNKCRIDRIATIVEGQRRTFTWGGGCSLHDKGTRTKKLPDLAPDPFRERRERILAMAQRLSVRRGRPRVAMTDEFQLKGLFPFFATLLHGIGLDLDVRTGADQRVLKRGIGEANVPFCAPMQLFHGLVGEMNDGDADYLFLPMVRSLPRVRDERNSTLCPIVQASADLLRWDLGPRFGQRLLSPVFDIGLENLRSPEFVQACRDLAEGLGLGSAFPAAFEEAHAAQDEFDRANFESGRRALAFCQEHGIVPVVVLGRPYTIHNDVLNSNVPSILRSQGAIAIPVDSYPVDDDVPIFQDMFWAQGQRILRAAHQIRRTRGVYSLFASNYSCGPDSFSVHFYAYMMEGKPFSILETDGHSGDAGTRTRVEAFLHCVREDLRAGKDAEPNDFQAIERARTYLPEMRRDRDRVLIPRMGPAAEALASCLRGLGIPAETLPLPDRESVRLGRRYTSGKECVPMCITLGSLLQRIERDRGTDERFTFFMPTSPGPCRFGTYQLLHKIVLERLGWKERVRTWSPTSEGYFDGVPQGFASLVFSGVMATDLLQAALYDVRPAEREPGLADRIHRKYIDELHRRLERAAAGDVSAPSALWEVGTGRLFGVADLLARAATEFAAARTPVDLPTVLVVGEIYVRCDPFANDFVVDRLEQRGIRVRFAPFGEWIEYIDHVNLGKPARQGFGERLKSFVQRRIQGVAYATVASRLGWPERSGVVEALSAATPYLRSNLEVESVLTVGTAAHEWREGHIDAVVSVGPLECMPNKIAEAQFFHVAEKEGLLSLTLSLNGDPVDAEILDAFSYEVHERFRTRREGAGHAASAARTRRLWDAIGRRWAPVAPGTMPFHVFAKNRSACQGACTRR